MKRVAIQGGAGAFHEIAAREYFKGEDLEIVPCNTFRDLFIEAKKDPRLVCVMAIENTIAGSLLPNHDLLKMNNLQIAGEHKLRVSHSLAMLPGGTLNDVKEVMSHPIAQRNETNPRNFTRFLILAQGPTLEEIQKDNNINKSSLVFVLPHNEGSLSQVLSVLSFYDINLTRIQSLPIIGRE